MKNVLTYISVFCFISGCGGAEPESFRSSSSGEEDTGVGGEDGAGGSEDSGTGGEDEGSGGDTSSTSTSSTSTSSGTCQPSVTCTSVGAECGTVLDDGCGNEIECPDNCTGVLTCGGGGDQFKCGCTPQTCLDLGAECGITDDGCGGVLDCGGCDSSDPYVSCGGAPPPSEFGETFQGEMNICDGGCTVQETLFAQSCQGLNQPPVMLLCSTPLGINPYDGCELFGHPHNLGDTWCCPFTE